MSKTIKTVASFALPIAGAFFGGPIGGAIGGALGGAISGGGLKGALLGGITGYAGAGASNALIGSSAHLLPAGVSGPVTSGSGILGAISGGGLKALSAPITSAAAQGAGGVAQSLLSKTGDTASKILPLVTAGYSAIQGPKAAEKAAKIQAASADKALAQNTAANAPYTQLGQNATAEIGRIQADPAGYINNNPLYKSLADDANRRLLANQAAKGKVGSGGTAAALHEQLLNLGNGLVQQQIGTLQNQTNTGATAANSVGRTNADILTGKGDSLAAGQVGSFNASNTGYQNIINTLLALQGQNKTPVNAPNLSV